MPLTLEEMEQAKELLRYYATLNQGLSAMQAVLVAVGGGVVVALLSWWRRRRRP